MRIILTITIAFIFSIAGISISFSQIDSINQKKDGKTYDKDKNILMDGEFKKGIR